MTWSRRIACARGTRAFFNGCEHHLDAKGIPLSEGSRLLLNRCSGLLLATELLKQANFGPEESDFVGRNLAKAQLALGDAVLVACGQYHWSCRERDERLQRLHAPEPLIWLEEVRRHHAAGVEFKLHPKRVSKSAKEFENPCAQIVDLALELWLWIENRRLGRQFRSPNEYAFASEVKWSDAHPWRNWLLNLRTFGLKAACSRYALRYPRERLFNSLALLLWNGDVADEPRILQYLQEQLHTEAADWHGFVSAYKQIWPQYG